MTIKMTQKLYSIAIINSQCCFWLLDLCEYTPFCDSVNKLLLHLSTWTRVICDDLFSGSTSVWYQWFFQNNRLSYHAGLVKGVNNKHHATNPITNNDINIILWGSLYVKISEKSGKPMWLQNAWAANGATKWPIDKRECF